MSGELSKIFSFIGNIAKVFIKLAELVKLLFDFLINVVPQLFTLLNPINLLNNIISGVKASLILVYNFVKNLFGGSNIYNKLIPTSLKSSGGIFGLKKGSSNGTCVQPTIFRLLLMIVCPPFALFMKIGLANWGWFYITTCIILTIYGYYFPGLIYAAMHILC